MDESPDEGPPASSSRPAAERSAAFDSNGDDHPQASPFPFTLAELAVDRPVGHNPPLPPPISPRSSGSWWRVVAGALGGMALSAVLVVGGYALGQRSDKSVSDGATPAFQSTVLNADDATNSASRTLAPAPLAGVDAVEPVAAVAAVVSPSVVLIQTGAGQGSGIVWDAENGYIVTNNHVTADATTVRVLLHNGVEVSGLVVGGDSARDIAVVEVDTVDLELVQASFAATESVKVGQLAVAIGSPFGLVQSVTAGIVSAVNRIYPFGGRDPFGGSDPANPVPVAVIQTDAPINPGNSGGALADREGRVIGMNTSIRTGGFSADNAGVGFAVPSDTVVLIAERIIAGESLELGFLGVSGDTLTDGTLGALVTDVVAGAPAEAAGIETGDLIISVNGKVVATMEELAADFKFYRPGEQVEVEVLRDGTRIPLTVTVGSN